MISKIRAVRSFGAPEEFYSRARTKLTCAASSTTGREDAVKKSETESDVIGLRRGTELNTESYPIDNMEPREMTQKAAFCGVARNVTELATRARNSPLNADEEQRLTRIARDRANRFMVAAPDVDFLLDVIVRLSR